MVEWNHDTCRPGVGSCTWLAGAWEGDGALSASETESWFRQIRVGHEDRMDGQHGSPLDFEPRAPLLLPLSLPLCASMAPLGHYFKPSHVSKLSFIGSDPLPSVCLITCPRALWPWLGSGVACCPNGFPSYQEEREGKGRERVPWGNDGENWQLVTAEPVEFEE